MMNELTLKNVLIIFTYLIVTANISFGGTQALIGVSWPFIRSLKFITRNSNVNTLMQK